MRLVAVLALLALAALFAPMDGVREEINERRATHNCAPLRVTRDELVIDARQHSRAMAKAGYIYHSVLRVGSWSLVGEVVGVGTTWRGIVRALFESPPHREILLDCRYDKIAIGLIYDNGLVWLTGRLYAE